MSEWLVRNRVMLFAGMNAVLAVALLVTAPLHGAPFGQVLYVMALFMLCSVPLTLIRSLNGRYSLLLIFMFFYFMNFGGVDVQHILLGVEDGVDMASSRTSFITPAEGLILACGFLILLGYLAVAGIRETQTAVRAPAEWSTGKMLVVGLGFWVAGTASMVYMGVFVVPESSNQAMAQGMAALGALGTFMMMLGQLLQPLGLLLLSYAYARVRGRFWTAFIIAVVLTQTVAGFVTDVKTTAMLGVLIVVVVRFLVDNRPPLAWTVSAMIAVTLVFPVFQANRVAVTGQRGLNHLQAFQDIGRTLQIALEASRKTDKRADERSQSAIERLYIKDNLEQVVAHLGVDVPYIYGESLKEIAYAFVPRLLKSDKTTVSVGQLYTRQIVRADTDTYISISHIGDLYWNFGLPGTLLGMLATGLILGVVGTRFSLENGPSLTHVMILLVTIQYLCINFQGQVSLSYVVWLRSMAAIGLLHLLFARRQIFTQSDPRPVSAPSQRAMPLQPTIMPRPAITGGAASAGPLLPASSARFPNVMR